VVLSRNSNSGPITACVQGCGGTAARRGSLAVMLQVLRVPETAVDKVVAERRIATGSVSASPVVSVEPRVRKFHQPVTITIPLPPHSRYRDNRVSNTNSLRLLCSMSGSVISLHSLKCFTSPPDYTGWRHVFCLSYSLSDIKLVNTIF